MVSLNTLNQSSDHLLINTPSKPRLDDVVNFLRASAKNDIVGFEGSDGLDCPCLSVFRPRNVNGRVSPTLTDACLLVFGLHSPMHANRRLLPCMLTEGS